MDAISVWRTVSFPPAASRTSKYASRTMSAAATNTPPMPIPTGESSEAMLVALADALDAEALEADAELAALLAALDAALAALDTIAVSPICRNAHTATI